MKTLEQYLQYMERSQQLDPEGIHLRNYIRKKDEPSDIEMDVYSSIPRSIAILHNNTIHLQIKFDRLTALLQDIDFKFGKREGDALVSGFPETVKGKRRRCVDSQKRLYFTVIHSVEAPIIYARFQDQPDLGKMEEFSIADRYFEKCPPEESELAFNIWMHFVAYNYSHDALPSSDAQVRDAAIPFFKEIIAREIPAMLTAKGREDPYFNLPHLKK